MRHVPEAGALHVVIGDFGHQFGSQRFPRQILALAPAALATGNAMPGLATCGYMLRPLPPRMAGERVLTKGCEEFHEFPALVGRETRADTHMLQGAGLAQVAPQLGVLGVWLLVSFTLALKLFRWR